MLYLQAPCLITTKANPKPHLKAATSASCRALSPAAFAEAGGINRQIALPRRPSLLVLGAHYFGGDYNDPLFAAIHNISWSTALLVEASPPIAAALKHSVAARPPLPLATSLRVLNEGICPGERRALPFFSFARHGSLPRWASQTGSFNRSHLTKHFSLIQLLSRQWSASRLEAAITSTPVPCGPLSELMEREQVRQPSVLMIDIEGFDCQVVASLDWCAVRPALVIYEYVHCADAHLEAARRSIRRPCADGRRYEAVNSGQNVFNMLVTDRPPAAARGKRRFDGMSR